MQDFPLVDQLFLSILARPLDDDLYGDPPSVWEHKWRIYDCNERSVWITESDGMSDDI